MVMMVISGAVVVLIVMGALIALRSRGRSQGARATYWHDHGSSIRSAVSGLDIECDPATGEVTGTFAQRPARWTFEALPGIGVQVRIVLDGWDLPLAIPSTQLTDASDLVLFPGHTWGAGGESEVRALIHQLRDLDVQNIGSSRMDQPRTLQITPATVEVFAARRAQIEELMLRLERLASDSA